MNKIPRIATSLRSALLPIRRKAHSGHAKEVTESSNNSFISKYWDDKPMYPQTVVYRNNYKTGGWQVPKKQILMAEIIGGLFWWWVFWHCWHDFGHLVGHFEPPDPSQWSDEELGIPPDDVE